MKKFISLALILATLLAIMPLTVFAATGTDGLTYKLSDNGKYYIVTGYNGTSKEVVIPSNYNGKPVKEIGDSAFESCVNIGIKNIQIPNTVIIIRERAFRACGIMTSIAIPDSVTTIGFGAFADNYNLEKILVPATVTKIEAMAFHNCGNIYCEVKSKPTGWDDVWYGLEAGSMLSQKRYWGCVIIDDIVYALNENATFYIVVGYIGEPETVKIVSSYNNLPVKYIEEKAFYHCTSLKNISIPDSIISIGNSAFYECSGLINVTIGNAVATISDSAFYGCKSINKIVIPDTVKTIAESAFYGCANLSSVKLGSAVQNIGVAAFYACKSLRSIFIPKSVRNIGASAFDSYLDYVYTDAEPRPNGWNTYMVHENLTEIFWNCISVKIDKQPVSITVVNGATAKATVTATGDGLTYKWYYKNKGDSKFTLTNSFKGNSYSVEMNSTRAGRQVYCVITDKYGNSVKTNTVTLNMSNLKITTQPKNVCVQSGKTAKVTVTATGDGLKYKWYFKNKGDSRFTLTTSFTGSSYSIAMNNARAGRQVYCVITDKYGASVKTNTVTLGIPVKITKQPATVAAQTGKTAKVTVSASGDGLKYKWYYKNKGATKFTLTTSFTGNSYSATMDSTRAGRQIYCVITDKYGNKVQTKTVTLGMAAKITTQPTSVNVANGKAAKVTVKASGDGLKYKWYFKDKGASKFTLTTTFTGTSYSVAMSNARAGRQVYCVITDKYGNSVKTNTVTLNKK